MTPPDGLAAGPRPPPIAAAPLRLALRGSRPRAGPLATLTQVLSRSSASRSSSG